MAEDKQAIEKFGSSDSGGPWETLLCAALGKSSSMD